MFRNWRRQWRRQRALKRIAPRVAELEGELSEVLSQKVRLESSGARGRDSIFVAKNGAQALAMIRLINPYLKRKPVPKNMPYAVGEAQARLAREWSCYEQCSALGISPEPLWRTHDAIACEYLHGASLAERFDAQRQLFWSLNLEVSKCLATLHANNMVHMDASLANTIASPDGLYLVDFEYEAAAVISTAQARCYDHLRLVESGLKFVPESVLTQCDDWVDTVIQCEPESVRETPLEALAPALPRLLAHTSLRTALARGFRGLTSLETP